MHLLPRSSPLSLYLSPQPMKQLPTLRPNINESNLPFNIHKNTFPPLPIHQKTTSAQLLTNRKHLTHLLNLDPLCYPSILFQILCKDQVKLSLNLKMSPVSWPIWPCGFAFLERQLVTWVSGVCMKICDICWLRVPQEDEIQFLELELNIRKKGRILWGANDVYLYTCWTL